MHLTGLRVLIVEDETLVAMMVEDYLNDLGCCVTGAAARLDDALCKAQTLPIDLAVLDVNLGGQLSYPVAEVLRSRGVPFVFATGYSTAALPESLRGVPVVTKPFLRQHLAKALLAVAA
jgi:CheY-like chemotaxis protein